MFLRPVMVGLVLGGLMAHSAPARADPFNTYGVRTAPGVLGFNGYAGGGAGDGPWGALYVFTGVAPWMDVVVAGSAFVDGGQLFPGEVELLPRIFPSPDVELALAGHLFVEGGRATAFGPELHLMGYATPALGLWINSGVHYDLTARNGPNASPADPAFFTWLGMEVTDGRAFVALEVDLESIDTANASTTVIPSVGRWVGREGGTGLSVGCWVPLDGSNSIGVGAWFWREVDLGLGARRRIDL